MRTNPPGAVREEGEGKKPTVVGEPGGLQWRERPEGGGGRHREKEDQNDNLSWIQSQWLDLFSANKAPVSHQTTAGNFCKILKKINKKRPGSFQ